MSENENREESLSLRSNTDSATLPIIPAPSTYGSLLMEGWNKANIIFGGGLSLVITTTVAELLNQNVPAWVLALVGCLLAWLASILLSALVAAKRNTLDIHNAAQIERQRWQNERARAQKLLDDNTPPKIEAAVAPFSPYKTSKCIFIVRWSPKSNLPIGAQVTISKAQNNHERPLGNGQVRPPQQDGLAVVTLDWLYDDVEDFVGELLDHRTNSDAISCIRIGPGYDLQGVGRSPVITDSNQPSNMMAAPPSFQREQS